MLMFYPNWLAVASTGSILGNTFKFRIALFYSLSDVLIKKNEPKIWNLGIFDRKDFFDKNYRFLGHTTKSK